MKISDGDIITTTGGHGIEKGATLAVYSFDGTPKDVIRVIGNPSGHTLSIRGLRWHEKAWLWVKRTVKRAYIRLRESL